METFELQLASAHMLADGNRHLVFERCDGQPLDLIPGQFIQVHFPHQGNQLRRSYSVATIASSLAASNQIAVQQVEIAVSYVQDGIATALFSQMTVGETIQASGPNGRLCLPEQAEARCILIGTGTGVTPYRAMLPEIERRLAADEGQFVLLFGARSPDLLLYDEDFIAFADQHEGFCYRPCLSREGREPARADDRSGRVTANLAELNVNPEQDLVFLCGNPEMIDECFAWFREQGFDTRRLRREKYVSPPAPRAKAAPLNVV